jgi:hypothetical protein
MMRLAALALAAILAAPQALADWPTTSFVPVPPRAGTPQEATESGFETFAEGAGRVVHRGGRTLTVDSLDIGALRRGAVGAMTDIMRLVSNDAAKMQAAGFPAPKIEPLLQVQSTGEAFYPIFWVPTLNSPFRHNCDYLSEAFGLFEEYRWTITANGNAGNGFPYSRLNSAYVGGGTAKNRMLAYMSSQLTHEVVHAVQANGYNNDGCGRAPKWLNEGTADGIAYYLASKRIPHAFDTYAWMRNTRRYDVSLDAREFSGATNLRYSYAAGSFFRYLIEATESGGASDLKIMKDMLTMPPSSVASRNGVIEGIDRVIKANSGGRGLYRVLPEFLTEYASYGGSRYKSSNYARDRSRDLTHDAWMDEAFLHCVDFFITPGASVKKQIKIRPLAGECVKVTWDGFTEPVALQFFAEGAGADFGALHMGEAVRSGVNAPRYCYDTTKGLSRRLARKMVEKCILKRGAQTVSREGSGAKKVASWTGDFNLFETGEAYFIVTNVAKTPTETKELEFDLVIGSLAAKKPDGQHVTPRKPGGAAKPVERGMTNIDKRVHAISGSTDRVLFDGRSIFGDGEGIGFPEGVVVNPGEVTPVMTLVRGGDYWVGFAGARPGEAGFSDSALIFKDPSRFESGDPMKGIIFSGGMIGKMFDEDCGYELPATIDVLEQSQERLRFSVSGDLFDPMRGMGLGGGMSGCSAMRAMWVEHAEFEVSLPYGPLYARDSGVTRAEPPGQEVYDESDFYNGPNFGGIETSHTLATEGHPTGGFSGGGGAGGGGGGGGAGGGGAGGGSVVEGACNCACPSAQNPPNPACMSQCIPQWAMCREEPAGPAAQSQAPQFTKTQAPPAPRPPTATPEAQRKWFSRLISDQGLSPEVEKMLADDFAAMSNETRKYLIRAYRDGVR